MMLEWESICTYKVKDNIMKKYKKIDFCAKGGASDGLAYFGLIKELCSKDIKCKSVFLTSISTIMFPLWAVGNSARKVKAILKSAKYDRTMRIETDLEKKHSRLSTKILSAVGIFFVVKTLWNSNITKLLARELSWKAVKKAKRIDKMYIGFTTRNELKKAYSKWKPFILVMKSLLSNDIKLETCEKAYNNCKMFWASDDGVYTMDVKKKKLIRYSNDIIPLWKAVKCAIKNPVMNNFKIELRGEKQRPFDLGILNNQSNMGFIGKPNNSFYQFSCGELPPTEWVQGDDTLSNYVYNKHRPIKEYVFLSRTEDGFFGLNNKNIDEEYEHAKESNVFN